MATLILLTLTGFILLAAEVFLPGLVLGSLGGLCLIGASIIGFLEFDPLYGALISLAIFVFALGGFVTWLRIFPKTAVGRKILLSKTLFQGNQKPNPQQLLLGQYGKTLTPLRPAGTILIQGNRIDALSDGKFIEHNTPVQVIHVEGARIVVCEAKKMHSV